MGGIPGGVLGIPGGVPWSPGRVPGIPGGASWTPKGLGDPNGPRGSQWANGPRGKAEKKQKNRFVRCFWMCFQMFFIFFDLLDVFSFLLMYVHPFCLCFSFIICSHTFVFRPI